MTKRKRGWGGRRAGAGRKSDVEYYGEPTVPVMLRVPRSVLKSLRRRIERENAETRSLSRWIVAILQNLNP